MPLIRDQLNATYKCRAPRLPETVDKAQTDLLMISLVTCITMKVTHKGGKLGKRGFL